MNIRRIKINNYKSFHISDPVDLSGGFNIIVGRNNSGKTSFAQAVSLNFRNQPHRSKKTAPYINARVDVNSVVEVLLSISGSELRDILIDNYQNFGVRSHKDLSESVLPKKVIELFSRDEIQIECVFNGSGNLLHASLPGLGEQTGDYIVGFSITRGEIEPRLVGYIGSGDIVPQAIIGLLKQRIYFFQAERFNVGESPIRIGRELLPDSSNLAQVLHNLQTTNQPKFNRLVQYLQTVFPEIRHVAVPPVGQDPATVRILIWEIDPITEREDLAVPLQESGTGVGQVLAMLYVVLTAEFSKVIVIDEPQSFLHPGAVRKLFSIFRQDFGMHQYIITTHSPVVINASDANTIIKLSKIEAETKQQLINREETTGLRELLSEVGARLSDVFGADNIIWVEGQTEEHCFPVIVSRILNKPLLGTAILGLVSVGDIESRDPDRAIQIYTRLSAGTSLLPPALGFILDQEGRSPERQADLKRRGNIHFLARRMFENFLINGEAIYQLISSLDGMTNISRDSVNDWISKHHLDDKYYRAMNIGENWARDIDGALFFRDLFSELTETKYPYEKVDYGIKLTSWIAENSSEDLEQVAELLNSLLPEQ